MGGGNSTLTTHQLRRFAIVLTKKNTPNARTAFSVISLGVAD